MTSLCLPSCQNYLHRTCISCVTLVPIHTGYHHIQNACLLTVVLGCVSSYSIASWLHVAIIKFTLDYIVHVHKFILFILMMSSHSPKPVETTSQIVLDYSSASLIPKSYPSFQVNYGRFIG